ncbi:ATP-binding cassette domain-containing protein [Streptomyces sp. ODS28]|uniref:ATP-binding cassette domain-containing protein n=1 Tax=Streptomyces sp. ODS28 TaxID=3136688 RepID=UPI0031E71373
MSTPMRLRGVGRRYGAAGPWVLRDVDLALPEGALLRFEGANGGGKSTLLRLLAGVDAPSAGRITGRPRCGYVPERFPAALPLTARRYLTRLARVHGLDRAEAARAAGEWLERFGAGRFAGTRMDRLSKGSSQKVAVAQALLARPGLLVLDEAWTGLDAAARAELDRAVAERVTDGGTVAFVDHDPRRLAGRADAAYRVTDAALVPVRPVPPQQSQAAPAVVIEAEGPPGADPPPLPGGTEAEHGPGGTLRLTAPEPFSDAVLRALLTARPPWHVRTVTRTREGGRA